MIQFYYNYEIPFGFSFGVTKASRKTLGQTQKHRPDTRFGKT
jgi:hypothetical protein